MAYTLSEPDNNAPREQGDNATSITVGSTTNNNTSNPTDFKTSMKVTNTIPLDAKLNEFTPFIIRKPFGWLIDRVPNVSNFLSNFSNLIDDYNGFIVGGYLRRTIESGNALQFQNADLDIMFLTHTDFISAVSYVNQGNLSKFTQPDAQTLTNDRVVYDWNLISNRDDIPNIKLQLTFKESENIENILSSFDFTNAKIATDLNQVIVDSRWENFELNGTINIDQVHTFNLKRFLKYLYNEDKQFKLNDSSALEFRAWVRSNLPDGASETAAQSNSYMQELYNKLLITNVVTYDTISFVESSLDDGYSWYDAPETYTGNYITDVNLEASITSPPQFVYQLTGEPYYGLYHKHLDGTLMIGAGVLGTNHTSNNIPEVIILGSEYQYTEDTDSTRYDIPPIDDNYIKEVFANKVYEIFFNNLELPSGVELDYNSLQTTIRDGKITTGRQEDEQLVFFKKDSNTPENKKDFADSKLGDIITDISASIALNDNTDEFNLVSWMDDEISNNNISIQSDESTPDTRLTNDEVSSYNLNQIDQANDALTYDTYTSGAATEVFYLLKKIIYKLKFNLHTVNFAEIEYIVRNDDPENWVFHEFKSLLNLSQITLPIIGNRLNIEKAKEILDTNIFELLPNQRTRQDQVNDFFNEFNQLIGPTPGFIDVDNDGAGEEIQDNLLDQSSRISIENKENAYITRLDKHTDAPNGEVNKGKTLETMRNRLNKYLGDVDNVIQTVGDDRPEYENISNGFLKIRKPNQAIILRAPNDGELEFQKNDSYLTDGFTITMWVRFVSKVSEGTLFNFGNPLAADGKGLRLDTKVNKYNGKYYRYLRLMVRDNNDEFYDNHWGDGDIRRFHQRSIGTNAEPYDVPNRIHKFFPNVPTDNLDEWYFICASYNPNVNELNRNPYDNEFEYLYNKQYWLNHILPTDDGDEVVSNSNLGAKCKVEIISRADLLNARGYKIDSTDLTIETIKTDGIKPTSDFSFETLDWRQENVNQSPQTSE